jgi:hypothetical protein
MKFNSRTIQILRNFSTINPSLLFKPGHSIATISQSKTLMAKATIETEIETTFAIYELAQFLSAISMFDDPELTSGAKAITIGSGSEKINFTYAEPSLILVPPAKAIELPSPEVQFELKNDILTRTQKALGIIGAPEIAVTGDGQAIYLEALNTKNASESTYRVQVGETDKTFRLIFLAENIKLLPDDYSVSISSKGLSHFKGTDVEYWVAVEATSTYKG